MKETMSEGRKMSDQVPSYTKMTAEVYDAIYANKDYESEAGQLKKVIDKYKQTDGNELLDVATGTGAHLPFLIDEFKVTGVDLSPEQLEAARERLPDVEFQQADMRDFDLGKKFDVVTSLFSSIGYMHTQEDLQAAIGNMSKHLKPGGVLVIEPWLTKDVYDPNRESPPSEGILPDGTKVVRTATNRVDGNLSVIMMHHELDGPKGHSEFDEEHRLAMHEPDDFRQSFENAGLSFDIDPQGLNPESEFTRGIYIGVKGQ